MELQASTTQHFARNMKRKTVAALRLFVRDRHKSNEIMWVASGHWYIWRSHNALMKWGRLFRRRASLGRQQCYKAVLFWKIRKCMRGFRHWHCIALAKAQHRQKMRREREELERRCNEISREALLKIAMRRIPELMLTKPIPAIVVTKWEKIVSLLMQRAATFETESQFFLPCSIFPMPISNHHQSDSVDFTRASPRCHPAYMNFSPYKANESFMLHTPASDTSQHLQNKPSSQLEVELMEQVMALEQMAMLTRNAEERRLLSKKLMEYAIEIDRLSCCAT